MIKILERFFKPPASEVRRVVALIDYENIALADDAIGKGKILDFQILKEELLKIGNLDFALVFIPYDMVWGMKDLSELGYDIISCPKRRNSDKLEDKVDISIIRTVWKFSRYSEITDIAIISNDRHMLEAVNEAKNNNKKIHLFGILPKMAVVLKDYVGAENIKPVPLKNGRA